jgi:hypothetical protein
LEGIELAILSGQYLDRRIPDIETLASEVAEWEADRSERATAIRRRLATADARIKLKHLYPSYQP